MDFVERNNNKIHSNLESAFHNSRVYLCVELQSIAFMVIKVVRYGNEKSHLHFNYKP